MLDAILDVISSFPNVWIGHELEIIISSKTIFKMKACWFLDKNSESEMISIKNRYSS